MGNLLYRRANTAPSNRDARIKVLRHRYLGAPRRNHGFGLMAEARCYGPRAASFPNVRPGVRRRAAAPVARFIAMDCAPVCPLSTWAGPAQRAEKVVEIVAPAGTALARLPHAAGDVHRDVKAENIPRR